MPRKIAFSLLALVLLDQQAGNFTLTTPEGVASTGLVSLRPCSSVVIED
jgi:hypothetical protein